ncbi:hypothetical protein JCM5296_003413, partial [Sporobolomyces johnsonii]
MTSSWDEQDQERERASIATRNQYREQALPYEYRDNPSDSDSDSESSASALSAASALSEIPVQPDEHQTISAPPDLQTLPPPRTATSPPSLPYTMASDDTFEREDPPHSAKTTSTASKGGGVELAVKIMQDSFPEGMTAANWARWSRKLKIAILALDLDIKNVFNGKVKRADVEKAGGEKLEQFDHAAERLVLLFDQILGDAYTAFDDLTGDKIWAALVSRYGGASTMAERNADIAELFCKAHPVLRER